MQKSRVIRKIYMECPLCDKMHEVEERVRMSTLWVKDEEVTYEEHFFKCDHMPESESEFATGVMTNTNLLNARNAYRVKKGLLTSQDIVKIREGYGLSQVDLARLLGWGEATISRYESKAIQDEAYDIMLRLIQDNPLQALEFLKRNGEKFTSEKKNDMKERMMRRLNAYGKEFLARQQFEGDYVYYEELSDSNGYTVLNIDKIEAVTSYLARAMRYFYKVKWMNSLWYADALAYNRTGKTITGMVYRNEKTGSMPIGHESLLNLDNIWTEDEIQDDGEVRTVICPNDTVDYAVLDEAEREILNIVIHRFKDAKTSEMMMCREGICAQMKSGQIIPFSKAKEIPVVCE